MRFILTGSCTDVKPENILVDVSCVYSRLLIADFGVATNLSTISETVPLNRYTPSTRVLDEIGTLNYVAPERLKLLVKPPRSLQGLSERIHGGVTKRRLEIAKSWFKEEAILDSFALGCEFRLP